MSRVNLTVDNFKDCLYSLGYDYLEYSLYGDGSCLDQYDKIHLLRELSDADSFKEVLGDCEEYEDYIDIELCDIDLSDLNISYDAYVSLGLEFFEDYGSGFGNSESLESYVWNQCYEQFKVLGKSILEKPLKNICFTIDINDDIEYELEESEDVKAFFEQIEHLFDI